MPAPTVKGFFVKNHLHRLKVQAGPSAVQKLGFLYGKSIDFDAFNDYPVKVEVDVVGYALDILKGHIDDKALRSFEAGRLHYTDFAQSFLGRTIHALFPKHVIGFKLFLQATQLGAHYIFKNIRFGASTISPNSMVVAIENSDYPMEHFKGFLYECMIHYGLKNPEVIAAETKSKTYTYTLFWKVA